MDDVVLVAIAKNEKRYLPEWLAYHLAIGYSEIIVYDNESTDGSNRMLSCLAENFPIRVISWPSVERKSPQRSAYRHSLSLVPGSSWISFLDIDEFMVPWGFDGICNFLSSAPSDAASVGINWLGFGSSRVEEDNYTSVARTFVRCSDTNWANNRHIKTIAKANCIDEPHIHDVTIKSGRKLASDFSDLELDGEGKTKEVLYAGVQINHYQVKTWGEFQTRMVKGNANFPAGHPNHSRDASKKRFDSLDRNDNEDRRIARFLPAADIYLEKLNAALSDHRC